MKIGNPFGTASNVRCRCLTPKGEVCCMTTDRVEIEIPDETTEALVQAVIGGRSDAQAYASRMWTPDRGFLDIESFIGMRQVEADTIRIEMEQEKERQRQEKAEKAKAAREAKEREAKEREAKEREAKEREAKEREAEEPKEEHKEEPKGEFVIRREKAPNGPAKK